MLPKTEPDAIAKVFLKARAEKTPITFYPGAMPQTMAEAYAIQDAAIELDGRRVGGWKVGRIAPDLAPHFGSERITGPIFVDEIKVHGSAMTVYAEGFAAAEAEILLCLGDIGDREHDIESIRDCIIEVRTGIEIASSPFPDINRHGPAVTASDYGNNKGLVLGPPIPDWRDVDLTRMPVETAIDGETVGAATMANMLDGPFGSALFLIGILRARGIPVEPGTWVSAGAITGVHEIKIGQCAEAVFDGKLRVGCSIMG